MMRHSNRASIEATACEGRRCEGVQNGRERQRGEKGCGCDEAGVVSSGGREEELGLVRLVCRRKAVVDLRVERISGSSHPLALHQGTDYPDSRCQCEVSRPYDQWTGWTGWTGWTSFDPPVCAFLLDQDVRPGV